MRFPTPIFFSKDSTLPAVFQIWGSASRNDEGRIENEVDEKVYGVRIAFCGKKCFVLSMNSRTFVYRCKIYYFEKGGSIEVVVYTN